MRKRLSGIVPLGTYFESAVKNAKNPKGGGQLGDQQSAREADRSAGTTLAELKFLRPAFNELIELVDSGKISSKIAQEVFAEMFADRRMPRTNRRAKRPGAGQRHRRAGQFCDQAIAANPGPAADFKAGKAAALNFLKGQVMKLSKGKANPALVGEILERKLKA